ncbi:MAG: SH3 domain-containing protein [Roseburia sp.]|nr:SH3 domain-containing protein [Roseburia sp.]
MIKGKFLNRYSAGVLALCMVLALAACVAENNSVRENETSEPVGTMVTESSEAVSEIVTEQMETEIPTETESEAPEYTVDELEQMMYANTSVNVRNGPDASYEKLGTLSLNQEVKVTGQCNENNWYRVDYNGENGFVSGEYLASEKVSSWVADLDVAQTANQIIVVAADGNSATVSMHNKNQDGTWTEILSTSANIGRNGIGKTAEGDGKTPTGQYSFMFGFGNMPNPGTALPYTQVDSSYYWVDDSDSDYYNQFVSTGSVTKDWDSAEHIASVNKSYNYVLAIDYNADCVPGAGSAIFMHCQPTGGAGCIAVSEEKMIEIMKNVQDGCVIVIDSVEGVKDY